MSAPARIALIHATPLAMAPVAEALALHWPGAEVANILDDSLSRDRDRAQALTPAIAGRIGTLADYAIGAGAQGILYTCSAFGRAIEAVAARAALPVLTPNEAMFTAALGHGSRIAMVYTFEPSRAGMETEFAEAAQAAGRDAAIVSVMAEGARAALESGDAAAHNASVARAAAALGPVDAIMLAHFSTARALGAVRAATPVPVLSAPEAAVLALRARLAIP